MPIDLTHYGFDNTVERFNQFLTSNDLWNSIAETSSAQAFVKMYAWVMETLSYLLEETIQDLKFGTSSSYQALLEHIKLVGYPARRKVSAEMTVTFSVEEAEIENITIPAGTRILVLDKYYVTEQQVQLIAGNLLVDADVVQGYRSTYNFSGDGEKDQQYDVNLASVENANIVVLVDGNIWTSVSSFYGQSNTNIFHPQTIYNGVRIEFGDGVFGNIPGNGAVIEVSVLVSDGTDGNITTTGVVGEVVDPIYAPDLSQVEFSVATKTTASGGQVAETIEDLKRNVPMWVTSGGVYKRKSEVKTVFEDFTEFDQVHIVAEADKSEAARDMRDANKIDVYVVPATGYTVDEATKRTLLESLIDDEKLLMNLTFNITEATYIYLRNVVSVYVPITVSYTTKENTIESRLTDFYDGFVFGDDHLMHLLRRALTEVLASDGYTHHRDTDISNLRITTYVIEKRDDFEDWWWADGFEGDLDYDELTDNGAFVSDETETDHVSCWMDHRSIGVLNKYPITSFSVEIDGTAVEVDYTPTGGSSTSTSVMGESGVFASTSVQGTINFAIGSYELTISNAVTGEVTMVSEYYDVDIPLDFSEYPLLEGHTITVAEEVNL